MADLSITTLVVLDDLMDSDDENP